MGNNRNKYLVQGTILAVSSIIVRIIGLLYRIPLTRIVGDLGMGYYGTAFDIYNLALLLSSYSIPVAVSKLVSARESKKEYKNSRRVFVVALTVAVLAGGVMSLIIYFMAPFFGSLRQMPSVAIPLRVLAPTIFVFAIMGVLRGLFQGKNTMLPTAISQVLEQIANAVVSILAAYLLMKEHSVSEDISAYGAAGGTLGTFVGALTGFAFLLFIYSIYHPVIKRRLRKDKAEHQESYKEVAVIFGLTVLPIILSQTVYQLSGNLDNILFGQIMSGKGRLEEVIAELYGVYSNKYKNLTTVPVAIASAFGASIVPALAASFAKGDMDGVRQKIGVSIKINMMIAIPAAVGMGVLARPIIRLMFGSSNLELGTELLQLGSVAIVFFALSTITNGVLQGIERMRIPVRHAAISLAIHVIILFVLLQFMDLSVYGLVIGNITFALLICMLNWISIGKYLDYKQEIVKTFIIPTIASIIMGVITFFSDRILTPILPSSILSLVIVIVISVLVYGVLIVLMKGMNEEEMLGLPKGAVLVRLCKKLHLM